MAELKEIEKKATRQEISPESVKALTVDTTPDGTGAGLGTGPDLSKMTKSKVSAAPTYNSSYEGKINSLTKKILNKEEFSYNPEEDENYLQYKDSYTKAGKRAMTDTIGDVSANTGGLASSYATTAGQQAYNNYMGALADKIPELRQLAYEMYQDDYQRDLATLGMLQSLESGDYAKYRDSMSDYHMDRNYNYQLDRDSVLDARYEDQWDYQKATDQRDYLQSEYQFDANRTDRNNQFQMTYDSQERANALNRVITMGYVTEKDSEILGIPAGEPTFSSLLQLSQLGGGAWSGNYWANHPITDWVNKQAEKESGNTPGGSNYGTLLGGGINTPISSGDYIAPITGGGNALPMAGSENYIPAIYGDKEGKETIDLHDANLLSGGKPPLSYGLKTYGPIEPVVEDAVEIGGGEYVSPAPRVREETVEPQTEEIEYDDSRYGRVRKDYPTIGGKPITNETDGNGNNWIKVGGERMGMLEFTERLEKGEFEAIYNADGSVTYRKK